MKKITLYIFSLFCFILSCESIDGKIEDLLFDNYYKCYADMECGLGRHCSDEGVCAIECTTDKDCIFSFDDEYIPEGYYCSLCGRCLKKGEKDKKCIAAKDTICENDQTCKDRLSEDYFCGEDGFCIKKCTKDSDCKKLGRGWSCNETNACYRRCICNKDCYFFGWGYECKLPDGISEDKNCNLENPAYGRCVPREGGIDWGTEINYEKESFEYSGIWGWNVNYAVRTTGLPLVSQQDSVSIAYGLAKIIQNARGGISIYLKLCSIRLKNFKEDDSSFEDIAYIVVPDSYADAIPVLINNTDKIYKMEPGRSFQTDTVLDVRGARLPDPLNTPLPDYENLEYVFDQDRDQKPGMTVYVAGVLTGEVYNVQRWWVKYNVKVHDTDRLSGLIDFGSEETIVGASNKIFLTKMKVVPHHQKDRSYFRAIRLKNDADCNTVIEISKNQESFIYFTPHYSE